MPLNPRQAKFVAAYLKPGPDMGNGAQAAIAAGYSAKTARQIGSRLLTHVDVRAAIEKAQQKAGVTPEIVLGELLRIARADFREAFTEEGTLKPIREIPEDVARAIAGVEVEALFEGRGEEREQVGTLRKVKFWDKTRALEMLGRYLGMFKDKLEVTGTVKLEDLVPAAVKR